MRPIARLKPISGLLLSILLATCSTMPASARDLVTTVSQLDHLPAPPRAGFKVPSDPNMLFYLQRSTNSNTIVYAANIARPGQLDPKKPLDVFWRRYEDGGGRRPLGFFERTMAYGASPRPVEGHPNEFDANIVSFPEIKFRIGVDQSGGPEAVVLIGARRARLISAFVQVDESGFIPKLVFMDVYGIDKVDGRVLHEHLAPAKS
jgi:hypothetical protein